MAHRALTLKYRPQVFADMVGQDHVSGVLARALESGRIAHAFLFTGARGVGKTTSARILAKALNCERRASGELAGADPCNACASCLEITSGVSLDVAEIDGASNRGIADVQALREKVRFAPTGGRYRVVIIDEVHQLSNDAFAALLKTLEEPPAHLVFVFATTDPQKLPDTIRSRTQRFDFARVPARTIADRLLEIARREAADPEGARFTLTEGAALLIARKSEGALRDAVGSLDQVVSAGEPEIDDEVVRRVLGLADREAFFGLADAVLARDPRAALRALHEGFAKGIDARELAEGLSEHVRHLLVLQVDPDGAELVPAAREELERMRAQSRAWSANDLLRLLRIATEVLTPMRDSPQPLVHLEAAVLQMATLEPGETLAELLDRLERLERRLAGAPEGPPRPGGGPAPAPRAGSASRTAAAPPASARVAAPPPRAYRADPRAEAGAASRAPSARVAAAPASAGSSNAPARGGSGTEDAARSRAAGRPASDAAGATREAGGPASVAALAMRRPSAAPGATGAPDGARPEAGDPAGRSAAATLSGRAAAEMAPVILDPASEERWRGVVAAVNGRKRMLGAFLEESRFVGLAGDALVLATDDLHRAVIEEGANRALVGEEVERVFGRPLALRCAGVPAATEPAAPAAEPADVQAMIERAIAWFDGEVIGPGDRPGARATERNG